MRQLAVCLLCLAVAARAEPPAPSAVAPSPTAVESELTPAPIAANPAANPATGPATSTLRERIGEDAIRNAVKATLDESWENPRRHEADTLSATPYEEFGREFSEAKVPGCLRPDALKRQPTFFLSGLFAIPFVAVAKIRGKCR